MPEKIIIKLTIFIFRCLYKDKKRPVKNLTGCKNAVSTHTVILSSFRFNRIAPCSYTGRFYRLTLFYNLLFTAIAPIWLVLPPPKSQGKAVLKTAGKYSGRQHYSMENDIEKPASKKNKIPGLILKLVITGVCIWYVSKKIDFAQMGETLMNAKWLLLFAGVVCYMVSKVIAAIRLNIYFDNIGLALDQIDNLKLYWLGLFYNLFLPGSITGDAYKVIRLTKLFGVPYKKTTSAVLLDRMTGLLGLSFVLAFYGVLVLDNNLYIFILAAGAVFSTAACYFIIRKWF